ncbi:protein kinase domain-containing protein [Archangium sp.]|uniref:protein kinase domain-containing protein n=1 Tax=Archangium sp. TaxID=1872627 RepID=UPI0039C87D64
MAVAEGLLSREEAEALREEALRLGRAPLELLVERGRLSEDSLVSLRKESQEQTRTTQKPSDDTVTVHRPSREVPVLQAADFPVPGWERYQFMRLLGQGGMGQVFLAHDPRLRRDVALKFVRGDDPDAARRFVFEARAQARVVHERVCQVYEVGEVQGKPFIAMQYIDGQPLNQLAGELSSEQKAMVLRDAAEGVHAAHRVGLIHRDLKPSNIMVERTQDGSLKCYVMDFGLARDWKEGMTASGSVLGTPHYMAPEQARGEVTRLDRRADVYSLGATLYHLLTGTYPVQGSNHLEVLSNIPSVEPRPPRALDKDIPVDLEAIVLKCLEKERSARYDSARALAEDLERFLNGEPVHARPAGFWYRLRKKARRHRRAAVTLGSMALTLMALAGGYGFLLRREFAQLEQLLSRYTARVKDIENFMLHAHLSPPRDPIRDREQLREWMHELESWMREAGPRGQGPGHYALGRGHLALGDRVKAREHLENAWSQGYREPEVAYSLALVLGQFHQEQSLEMERQYRQRLGKDPEPGELPADEWLQERRQELELRLRKPLLEKLQNLEGLDDSVPHEYVQALIAWHEGRLEDALGRLDALSEGPPGFYAAPRLRGDIYLTWASRHWKLGEYAQARTAFGKGRLAYAQAAEIGRGDPDLHLARAQLERDWLEMETSSHGKDIQSLYEQGLQAVSRAIAVAPDRAYEARLLEARFHLLLAGDPNLPPEQAQRLLDQALGTIKAASMLEPERPEARLELGWVLWQASKNLYDHREDPREKLREAITAIERIAPKHQGPAFHMLRGRIYKTWADHESQTSPGADDLTPASKAIEAFHTALMMDPSQMIARVSLATAYYRRAVSRHGNDPRRDLEQARRLLEEARTVNPHYAVLYYHEALVHRELAWRLKVRGGDPRPEYLESRALFRLGGDINPESPLYRYNEAYDLAELAREEMERGGDPHALFEEAEKLLGQAIIASPQHYFSRSSLGFLRALHAEYLRLQGKDPEPSVRAAEPVLREVSGMGKRRHLPWANLAWLHYNQALFELEHEGDPAQSLAQGLKEIGKARELNAHDAYIALQHGRLLEVQALTKARRGQEPDKDFQLARDVLRTALDSEPENQELRRALGHLYWEWASWTRQQGGEPSQLQAEGLALAEHLVLERPEWQEARVMRAFFLLAAKDPASPEQQARALQVWEELNQTLKSNPYLQRKWEHHLQDMRKRVPASWRG